MAKKYSDVIVNFGKDRNPRKKAVFNKEKINDNWMEQTKRNAVCLSRTEKFT